MKRLFVAVVVVAIVLLPGSATALTDGCAKLQAIAPVVSSLSEQARMAFDRDPSAQNLATMKEIRDTLKATLAGLKRCIEIEKAKSEITT